jgi:RimJ/RimL family protein N-acetyltransferase
MNYKILKNKEFSLGRYKIVTLRHEDIFKIMQWRNEQIEVLRQKKPLTREDQEKYFTDVVKPTFTQSQPPIMLFSLLFDGLLIGYGGLVYIDWESNRAEVSFLVDPARAEDSKTYEADFSAYLSLLKRIAFDDLSLNRIYSETYSIRVNHIKILEKNGFKYEGTLKEHNYIDKKYVNSLMHAVLRSDYVKDKKRNIK